MKVALIIYDKVKEHSFYVKNGSAYRFDNDQPYSAPGSIENRIFRNIWNIPFVYDEGYFFSFREGLPDIDLDLIIAVAEIGITKNYNLSLYKRIKKNIKGCGLSEKKFIKTLRKKYKNAIIIGYSKEMHPWLYCDNHLINFLNLCDYAALPMQQKYIDLIQDRVNKKIDQLFFPYNLELIRQEFLDKEKKRNLLFVIASKGFETIKNHSLERGYSNSVKFADYLSKKYGYETKAWRNKLRWGEWLSCINQAAVCINLDPFPRFGQVVVESAILETPHLGSQLDAADYLFPTTASNDLEVLEEQFTKIIKEPQKFTEPAFQKLSARYSYQVFKENLSKILSL